MLKRLIRIFADLRVIGFTMALIVLLVNVIDYVQVNETFDVLGFGRDLFNDIQGNLATIAFTLLIVEAVTQWRIVRQDKEALILQLGSPNSDLTAEAARIMQAHGWLNDGTLKGCFLAKVNWEGGNFWEAVLEGAELMESNLQRTNFHKANLNRAKLWKADLQGALLMDATLIGADLRQAQLNQAEMWRADLRQARFERANLQGALLRAANVKDAFFLRANLRGVDLQDANLDGARLVNVEFDEKTILPDGTHWTNGIDIAQFTDSSHPNFWRPDVENNPPAWYFSEQDAQFA